MLFSPNCSSISWRSPYILILIALVALFVPRTFAIEYSVKAPLASCSLLLDGQFIGGRLVVVGERGHILLSDNEGKTWRQVNAPTRATLTALFFHNKDLGWAVGHDAVILRTKDGGESWEQVFYAPEEERPLLDVWFKDEKTGFAVGAYGLFLETSNSGDSWSARTISEEDWHLNQIMPSKSGRIYIAAEAGRIYRSDDQGESWFSLPSPYAGSFFGTLPLEKDTILLFGLQGHMYLSEDAGKNWRKLETYTDVMLTHAVRRQDHRIIVVGLAGVILVSRDSDYSFSLYQQPDRTGFSSVIPVDKGSLILIGESGVERISLPDI